jgi:uncharacterized membrane protein
MGFTQPLVLLLAVPLCLLTVVVWRVAYVNLSQRRKSVALVIRLVLIAGILLGLAGLNISLSQDREAVVFVADRSASDRTDQTAMQTLIDLSSRTRPHQDLAGVVSVGQHPVVEQPASPLTDFGGFQAAVNPDATNLEAGLDLAGAVLPDGYRHRIITLTDGQQNVGDSLAAARSLHAAGVRIDVVPLRVRRGRDVLVNQVDVPTSLRTRESFSLDVSLHSSVRTSTRLDIYRDNRLILSKPEIVRPGDHRYVFQEPPLTSGFHTFQARIAPKIDSHPQNNSGSAFTIVRGSPRLLVIAAVRSEAATVMASLHATGIHADLMQPQAVPASLSFLERYGAVVIVDTAAPLFDPDTLRLLVPYVRDLGHGLLVIGGQESYGLGGYGGTPLERVLPVKMNLPRRKELPSVAVALIIESLESSTPVNISKQAGKGVIRLLSEQDQIAVNDTPDDGSAGWVVPMQHARDKAPVDQAIDQMLPGDPASYVRYLRSAATAVRQTRARVQHIILLGDGDAQDPSYERVVKRIHAEGVTVSTVITNGANATDFQTMQDIARWGGGRYYRADDVQTIPKIFLRESKIVGGSGTVEGKFYPRRLSPNPMLRDVQKIPPLTGYVATTRKTPAEIVLESHKHDPILAAWQYGLGHAVAWTSDAAGLWTRQWLQAPGASRFWSNLASWTLPPASSGGLFVTVGDENGTGHVSATSTSSLGVNSNVTARVVLPGGGVTKVTLQPSAPNRYDGTFPTAAQGPYFVSVQARGGGRSRTGQAGLDVPYPPEYRNLGTNTAFLSELARAGGGSIISNPTAAWRGNLAPVYDRRSLADLLWLLAALLLPFDVAVRRLVIRRRDVDALREGLGIPELHLPKLIRPYPKRIPSVPSRSGSIGPVALGNPSVYNGVAAPNPQSRRRSVPVEVNHGRVPSPAPKTSSGSTASKLLEAKRRRKESEAS